MPEPQSDETRDDFIKRCIPIVIEDGTADDGDQAFAICTNLWERHMKDDKTITAGKIREFSTPIQIMEFKSEGDEWRVDGYASTFGNLDDGGDIVNVGAFDRTLKERPYPAFLKSHDLDSILGKPKVLKPDSKGLFGQFKISKTTLGADTRQLVLDGVLDSFSIGYSAAGYEMVENNKYRLLKDIDLYEISLVSIPMNREALVTGVKKYMTLAERIARTNQEIEKLLSDLRGLTENNARPLTEIKRQELTELLETFSGLDAVRSDLQSVLAAAPINMVDSHRVKHELAEARKRLAQILEE